MPEKKPSSKKTVTHKQGVLKKKTSRRVTTVGGKTTLKKVTQKSDGSTRKVRHKDVPGRKHVTKSGHVVRSRKTKPSYDERLTNRSTRVTGPKGKTRVRRKTTYHTKTVGAAKHHGEVGKTPGGRKSVKIRSKSTAKGPMKRAGAAVKRRGGGTVKQYSDKRGKTRYEGGRHSPYSRVGGNKSSTKRRKKK